MQGTALATRIRESRRRMRDPMYLAKLVQSQIADARRASAPGADPAVRT